MMVNRLGEGHVFSTPAAGEGVTGLCSFHFRMERHLLSGRNSELGTGRLCPSQTCSPSFVNIDVASTFSLVP